MEPQRVTSKSSRELHGARSLWLRNTHKTPSAAVCRSVTHYDAECRAVSRQRQWRESLDNSNKGDLRQGRDEVRGLKSSPSHRIASQSPGIVDHAALYSLSHSLTLTQRNETARQNIRTPNPRHCINGPISAVLRVR
nr:uncharacterized protein LOC112285989 [Physcomitrium patens]|eukprot:XP_024383212.1 uncharacterized protein LOC112285989 [Physcomitrella patens]